jgi:hypothetical protein
MSRRKQFRRLKDLQDNLKKYNAFSVYGYFPLFDTIDDAIAVSPVSSYHIHEFEGVEYYMPDGLEMGKTQFHGDYEVNSVESVPNYTYYEGKEIIIYIPGGNTSSSIQGNSTEQSSVFSLFRFYPDTQAHAPMSGPPILHDNDIAAFDNFIYQYNVNANKIFVWEANYVANTYTSLSDINFPTGVLIHGSNAHTIIKNGDVLVTYDYRGNLRFWNISGGPGSTCSLINSYYVGIGSQGDLTYHPITNTFIHAWNSSQNNLLPFPPPPPFNSGSGLAQIDMQGNILNSNVTSSSAATFRWKGDIYMFGQGGVRKVDVNNLTSQVFDPLPFTSASGGTFSHIGANGANETMVDMPFSYNCVQKGNHPKFGFKCKKVIGTGGQFATLQGCIDSGCEGIPPQTDPTIGNVTPPIITTPTQPIQSRLSDPENQIQELPITPSVTRTSGGGSGSGGY